MIRLFVNYNQPRVLGERVLVSEQRAEVDEEIGLRGLARSAPVERRAGVAAHARHIAQHQRRAVWSRGS